MVGLVLLENFVFFVAVLFFAIKTNRMNVANPLFYYILFHGLFFVFRPTAVYIFELRFVVDRIGFRLSDDLFCKTLLYANIGLLGWTLASALVLPVKARGRQVARYLLKTPSARDGLALTLTALLLLPIALYSLKIAIDTGARDGEGLSGLIVDPISGVTVNTVSSGYINDAQYMLGSLVILFLIWCRRFWLSVFVVLGFFVLRMAVGHDRWTFVFFAASLVILYAVRRGSSAFPWWVVAAAPPLVVIFNMLGQARFLIRDIIFGTGLEVPQEPRTLIEQLDGPDIANFEFLAFFVDAIPSKTKTYTYFLQWLQLFTEPVPRILWHSKPLGAPFSLFELNNFGDFRYYSRGMIGDAYMSLGVVGIILVAGVFGYLISRVSKQAFSGRFGRSGVILAIIVLPLLIQWLRDGGVVQISKFLMWNAAPVLVWSRIGKLLNVRKIGRGRPIRRTLGRNNFRARQDAGDDAILESTP